MLGIPFLIKDTRKQNAPGENSTKPDLADTITRASTALRENNPERALSLIAPFMSLEDIPDEINLVAGHALTSLGRFPEATGCLEKYLESNPDSVEGLLSAGLAAARARQIVRAMDWFNRACECYCSQTPGIVDQLIDREPGDPLNIEELIYEVESNPEDVDLATALACALGKAGHYRACEKFIPVP